MTLRLINDPTGVPPAASTDAHAQLPPKAFEELFNHSGSLLAILDDEARFVAVNPACMRVLGYPPEQLIGRSLMDCLHPHDPTQAVRRASGSGGAGGWQEGYVELLARHRHADGSWRSLLWSGSAHGDHWYASAKDVTEWLRLEHRVGRDPLTGLHNREVFSDELARALARHGRSTLHLGVLFIDLDSFKQINDSIGHEAGDHLLAEASRRLREAVRAGDVVGRIGGDEFAILLELLESDYEAVAVARRVLQAFTRPFELGSGTVSVSASVGLATAHDETKAADRLIREADIAMYRAKSTGRNRFAIFDSELRGAVDRRLGIERDLRAAIARGEFSVNYQPVVSLRDGAVVSCEALLRWQHPQWGLISPAEFIPLAEENGVIVELGAWVLGTALAQVAQWRAAGHDVGVSVNLSPRQLTLDNVKATVSEQLLKAGVSAEALTLEITETAVLSDPVGAAAKLTELRELGIKIAFDDFGTGYSSLRHLSQLPVDVIKLDRAFVSVLSGDGEPRDRAILIAVTAAARELAISVVAEGVEDTQQLAELKRADCSFGQGYLFADPRPAADVPLGSFAELIGASPPQP
ncbi:MAG TPA: EAL domain-containing protein [Solirubrobacteraceae bacterium]|nr:EAL domain-containing protein [Solirubrobacteraceae bacterium]